MKDKQISWLEWADSTAKEWQKYNRKFPSFIHWKPIIECHWDKQSPIEFLMKTFLKGAWSIHPLLIFKLLLTLLFAPVPFPNHGSHAVEKLSPTWCYECACVNAHGRLVCLSISCAWQFVRLTRTRVLPENQALYHHIVEWQKCTFFAQLSSIQGRSEVGTVGVSHPQFCRNRR